MLWDNLWWNVPSWCSGTHKGQLTIEGRKKPHTLTYWSAHCLKWKRGHTWGQVSYYQLTVLLQPSLSVLHDVRNTLVSSPSRAAIVLIFYEHVLNHKSWAETPAGSRSSTYHHIRLQVKDEAEEEVTYAWLTHKYVTLISSCKMAEFGLSGFPVMKPDDDFERTDSEGLSSGPLAKSLKSALMIQYDTLILHFPIMHKQEVSCYCMITLVTFKPRTCR